MDTLHTIVSELAYTIINIIVTVALVLIHAWSMRYNSKRIHNVECDGMKRDNEILELLKFKATADAMAAFTSGKLQDEVTILKKRIEALERRSTV